MSVTVPRRRWSMLAACLAVAAANPAFAQTEPMEFSLDETASDRAADDGDADEAGPSAAALDFFREGEAALKTGNFVRALDRFENAYVAGAGPDGLARQGDVLERMGEYSRAAERYEEALKAKPSAPERLRAERGLARVRPEVKFESEPGGAEIYIDRAKGALGVTPVRTHLVAGEHRIVLRKEGFEDTPVEFLMVRGRPTVVRCKLLTLSEGLVLDDEARRQSKLAAVRSAYETRTWFGWASAGLGGLAATGALALLVNAQGEADSRDSAPNRAEWAAHDKNVSTSLTGFYAAGAVAVIAAGTSAWFMLTRGPAPPPAIGPPETEDGPTGFGFRF